MLPDWENRAVMDILCVGLIVCDLPLRPVSADIFQSDRCEIESPVMNTGGDAMNVAATAARLGMSAALAGRVGRDANGRFVRSRASALGIDVSQVREDETLATAVSYVLIEPGGERHFLCASKIHGALRDTDLTDEALAADIVYFGSAMAMRRMDNGGIARLFHRAHALGRQTAMDTAVGDASAPPEGWLKKLAPALCETDYFLPSLEEARILTGADVPQEIAARLAGFGFRALVIKLGARGCYVTDFEQACFVPVFAEFQAVDTTGAGDSFVGGFLCARQAGEDVFASALFACAVAGFSVSATGATSGVPDRGKVEAFLKSRQPTLELHTFHNVEEEK